MDWFERLLGFREGGYAHAREHMEVVAGRLRSRVDGRSYATGTLETPRVDELRARARDLAAAHRGRLHVSCVTGDVRAMHADAANAGALFQVASQFNLLEMTGPAVTPEDGVTRYAHDPTQGPACAIAAGAATVYRNYFVPVGDGGGQTATRQIDCLRDVGALLGNDDGALWTMRNGYALCTHDGLARIAARLADAADAVRDALRIGVHRDVEATEAPMAGVRVAQAFCSALPVGYGVRPAAAWGPFATVVLEGAYEATLWAAVENAARTGSRVVFLTEVGGGAFGNDAAWIGQAMRRALDLVADVALDVRLVAYRAPSPLQRELVARYA